MKRLKRGLSIALALIILVSAIITDSATSQAAGQTEIRLENENTLPEKEEAAAQASESEILGSKPEGSEDTPGSATPSEAEEEEAKTKEELAEKPEEKTGESFSEKTIEEDAIPDPGSLKGSTIASPSQAPEDAPYGNYSYGDPSYNGNYTIGYTEDGSPIPELYEEDLDAIIRMAEEGMDLSRFFRGTLYSGFTLFDLYSMRDEGYSFADISFLYAYGTDEIPDWLGEALYLRGPGWGTAMTAGAGAGTMTSTGIQRISGGTMGVNEILGGPSSHGPIVKMMTTEGCAFCAKYGGTFTTGVQYVPATYDELLTPNGSHLTEAQIELLPVIVACYLKTTDQSAASYAGAQCLIWYIINHPEVAEHYYYETAWNNGVSAVAQKITQGDPVLMYSICAFLRSSQIFLEAWREGLITLEDISPMFSPDYYPGQAPNIYLWKPVGNDLAQWLLTWDIGDATEQRLEIPTIDNFYTEKEAVATYGIDITKESIITNELLSGISFEIEESPAQGSDLTYAFLTGEHADGSDYTDATVLPGSFGNTSTVMDPVPYMDDDVLPSGGNHRTTVTTDENGHASTTFTHRHTFKEYYSVCKNADDQEISHATYEALWKSTLKKAGLAGNQSIEVLYKGAVQAMTADEIQEIHDNQQTVYTQTQDEAMSTINDLYNRYLNRTYTYTVTELDTYTRPSDTDSNGKELVSTVLPKDGYRKDVKDATTVGPYRKVLSNGQTMVPGGTNDQDPNTEETSVTNEPWHNQIFINKTDLETNAQILYDTEFEIYEYYQYKAVLTPALRKLYPGRVLGAFLSGHEEPLNPENITKATLQVMDGNREVSRFELEPARLKDAINNPDSYAIDYTTTYSGDFTLRLSFDVDAAKDKTSLSRDIIRNATLSDAILCTCTDTCDTAACPLCQVSAAYCQLKGAAYSMYAVEGGGVEHVAFVTGTVDIAGEIKFTTSDGLTYITTTILPEMENGEIKEKGTTLYTCVETGTVYSKAQGASLFTDSINGQSVSTFTYLEPVAGIYLFRKEGQDDQIISGDTHYLLFEEEDGNYCFYYAPGGTLASGSYTMDMELSISANDIYTKSIDTAVNTDISDYTTWGQANYEIVRVTSDIAKKMGWPDSTIGMYTVHRKSPTDQYCGTTFTSHHDESSKDVKWGYYEYGTLYYTQANLGQFAIVEKTAPSDASTTGYLGNYKDRDYTKLDKNSSQKNYEGAPYDTPDALFTVKMVHYLDLCTDTNQYATYMLTDGYREYTSEYYDRYTSTIKDNQGNEVETGDGYDAHYYDQSSLTETIGLERFRLENPVGDVLNSSWDAWFSESLSRDSGLAVTRDSAKTDAFMAEEQENSILHHFTGTTIHKDSFDDNDSSRSNIAYNGTYTDTSINYHSYAGERTSALNERAGFHGTEFLQVGNTHYDNAASEKEARYHNTQSGISREDTYAFIDEREYAYIRFSKYDKDAQRYVNGDLSQANVSGTDHADADLDGAVYSLYVDESNTFTVDYLEGTMEGRLFWAQPLNGGWRIIWDGDADDTNGFTDSGDNPYEDFPHAYVTEDLVLFLDYYDESAGKAKTRKSTATYHGIRHPDGQYGGKKHNGFFAVLEEQQVFLDLNNDGHADTWTLEDVTLYAGAKTASAVIRDGELEIDGLYLGDYYLAEEIRDAITIHSTDNNDQEYAQNRFLSFAPGYTADTDESGNPVIYLFSFPYKGLEAEGGSYTPELDYVHKDTSQVSNQAVVKGGGAQFHKITSNGESSASGNTEGEPLEGAGFTVYLLSELSLITDGTIKPAYEEIKGHELAEAGNLVKRFDKAGNMAGYAYTKAYMKEQGLYAYFEEKYPEGYNLEDVNQILYVKDRGYYYAQDILGAYKNQYYDNATRKWDFSREDAAIARIYEKDAGHIEEINAGYAYVENHLNSGSPCEYYGVNGLSEGWVPTGVKNEYRLSEIFSNHYGNLRIPELSYGAYIMIETTTPEDVFTADPVFFAITDSSASLNRSKTVAISDAPIVSSLVLVKRDAQTGQDVQKAGTSYRIFDYTNNQYISKYLRGENGALSLVAQRVFKTDDKGRINAVASLECGKYRIEELSGPRGFHNAYWDYGNATDGERLGGVGTDADTFTEDNLFQKYYGTKDFEVTTERLYKSSGIVSSDNLDYIYIGESFYNDEIQGKLTISKTGEVLVGYQNTSDIEYADEYTDASEKDFRYSKAMMRDRAVFEAIKKHYDLGRDETVPRNTVKEGLTVQSILPVSYIAMDEAGMGIAAIYADTDGTLKTMNGGTVNYMPSDNPAETGNSSGTLTITYDLSTLTYENARIEEVKSTYVYTVPGQDTDTSYLVTEKDGHLTTKDGGIFIREADGSYTLTYEEAVYTPDITDEEASETFDFVYEERPLANATYVVRAAEDIMTQDGGEHNTWFEKGDVVATVTTANDGELVNFAPSYNQGGSYASTYYYGNSSGTYTSFTKENQYGAADFSTSGGIENQWTPGHMDSLDLSLFGLPSFTDPTVYPNTYYREETLPIYRRIQREGAASQTVATDYQSRLEHNGGLDSEGCQIVTQTPEGFLLSSRESVEYKGAVLKEQRDTYLLETSGRSGDGMDIEVRESRNLYQVAESLNPSSPWKAGDLIRRTPLGYQIVHTEDSRPGIPGGSSVDAAHDLGYTVSLCYPNAVLYDNGDNTLSLYDENMEPVVRLNSGILVTQAGGILTKTRDGYRIDYEKTEEITANQYVTPSLTVKEALLTIKDETYRLSWDSQEQCFKTARNTKVSLSPDYASIAVTTGGETKTYQAFDLLVEYTLHYAEKEDIVTVEKDGTPGAVSLYLPLGKYTIQEVKTPYGFLLSNQIQTVEFSSADQVKEIVFNTSKKSTEHTRKTMDIWSSKGLSWFVGGFNTIGEALSRMQDTDFFTWGTYGEAESAFFEDKEGFVNFFDLRVKAWSQKEVPEPGPGPGPEPTPEDDRHEESEENQWKLGVGIYKADAETDQTLKGAKFGLYTSDAIYNADGKLLVPEGALLATATTDDTGFANFAVDIALMSRNLDTENRAPESVYEKSITYAYDALVHIFGGTYRLSADACDDLLLVKQKDDSYKTPDGLVLTIDEDGKTVSYTAVQSIDGNTAMNTGRYHVKELTPPDGYLYDDTIYDLTFVYDDAYTMYIPVYAKHANEKTKVFLNKLDLTGQKEVPGASISLYKIKDIHNTDGDGIISHADDNLLLLKSWVSGETAQEISGLSLSNIQWPRLENEEERENIYLFRECIPADGYVSAQDIEFKLYQTPLENGWVDPSTGKPWGYEVQVCLNTCEQAYERGFILSPGEHADGASRDNWDYTTVLDGAVQVTWLLVNKNLVLSFSQDASKETIDKILKEEDFSPLAFDTVYLDFAGRPFEVDFYRERQAAKRPAGSFLHYDKMWYSLADTRISMYDDTTKLVFDKQDLVTGADVIGAKLEIRDETGRLVDSWITQADEKGAAIPHQIEGILAVGRTYTLTETLAPVKDGYVKSNSITFTVQDDGHIQKVVMQDDFTKLLISKADLSTGEEVAGAMLEIWSTDKKEQKKALVEQWVTGSDGYDAKGHPRRHYMEYLPVGDYLLVETMAPEGYLTAESVPFTITETGLLQKVQMFDASTALKIYKYQTGTTTFVPGAKISIYSVPEEYVKYLTDRIQVETDGQITAGKQPEEDISVPKGDALDLLSYLTGISAKDTEHRGSYDTTLTLQYSMPGAAFTKGYTFTQYLPETLSLSSSDLDTLFVVRDKGRDAFTYLLEKKKGRYAITVSFDAGYIKAGDYDAYSFYLTFGASISDAAMLASGRISVPFTDTLSLSIRKEDIREITSSLTEPAATIHLTADDLAAAITTGTGPVTIPGLPSGWYIALETSAPKGYILDSTPQVFHLSSGISEQALTFYNQPEKPHSQPGGGGTPGKKPGPVIGKLLLRLSNGFKWSNVKTEDNGQEGSSILLTIESNAALIPPWLILMILTSAATAGFAIYLLGKRKRRKKHR